MKTYLIALSNSYQPKIIKEYDSLAEGRSNFTSDVNVDYDKGYTQAFTYKLVKASNTNNAIQNYSDLRNYMREAGETKAGQPV